MDYSNDKRSRRIDDDKDDDCYDEEENEFDYSNIEEEIVVGIDYKFCPDLMNWLLTQIGLDYTKLDWATLLVKAQPRIYHLGGSAFAGLNASKTFFRSIC